MNQTKSFPSVKVAVALLTYNNRDLLEQFLPDIIASIPATGDYGLFVIDNASTDDTQAYLKQFESKINIIKVPVNRGFTNGYKTGLAQIDADIYCLLSSDVQISKNWLEPVIELFDKDSKIGVIQPKIKAFYRRDEFEYAGASGGFIDKDGYPFCRGRIFYSVEKDNGQYDENIEIFWASGACFFVRADLYHESGGLDDEFYAHMEEIDLCWRIKNRGYKIMACPKSEVYHMGGAVIAYGSPQKVYRNHRNNLIMMIKNYPKDKVAGKIIKRLFMDALAFGNMIMRGQIKPSFSIVHAHWNFFWHLPKWIKKRRETQDWVVRHCHTGIYPKSIVSEYFAKGKKHFSDLGWKP